jgi:hypothetical protein
LGEPALENSAGEAGPKAPNRFMRPEACQAGALRAFPKAGAGYDSTCSVN